jgi:hypothetical protein
MPTLPTQAPIMADAHAPLGLALLCVLELEGRLILVLSREQVDELRHSSRSYAACIV